MKNLAVKASGMPMPKLCLLLSIMLFSTCLKAQTHTPITTHVTNNINGYWEYLPADYKTSTKSYPLMIFFHGVGEVGDGSTASLQNVLKNGVPKLISQKLFPSSFTVKGKTYSFIVISPQFINTSRSILELNQLIDYCCAKYRVDKSKIYFTGLSFGGGTCEYYASNSSSNCNRIAAMLPIAGNFKSGADLNASYLVSTNLPVWFTHNQSDPTVSSSISVNWANKLNNFSPKINPGTLLTIFPVSGHDAWTKTYDPNWRPNGLNVYEWMLQYSRGASSSGSLTAPANVVPVASIKTVSPVTLPTNSVILDGSGSSDKDGSIKSYAWSYVSGPAGYSLSNASTSKATASKLIAGTYVFKLVVTDNSGATTSSTVSVNVNVAPVATVSGTGSITLPVNSVSLDGSLSKDGDGTIKSYSWTYVSGPSGYIIGTSTSAKTSISNLIAGSYIFKLTVTDDKGGQGSVTKAVTVNSIPNAAPVASISGAKNITLPVNSLALDGSASKDADGTIKTYAWKYVSSPSGSTMSGASTSKVTLNSLTKGSYQVQLTVTDDKGATATSSASFTVNAATTSNLTTAATATTNQAPVVTIKAPVKVYQPATSIRLDGSSSKDADGTIEKYDWTRISGPSGYTYDGTSSPALTINDLRLGSYSYKLTVTDDKGATGSASFTFNVVADTSANLLPVAVVKAPTTVVLPTTSILLDGSSSSDKDGTISSYKWSRISSPGGYSYVGNGTSKLTINGLKIGTYVYDFSVTDNRGGIGKTRFTFNVAAAGTTTNVAPVASITGTSSLKLPTNSTILDGSGSSDNDGSISTYAWKYVSGPTGYTLTNAATSKLTVSNLVAGSYVFQLTVTDNKGATGTAQYAVSVASANTAPVASITGTKAITLPTNSTTLDGSGSTDSDGSIKSYVWSYVSGPSGYSLSGATTSKLTASNLTAGSYTFKLTVTDNSNATASANAVVTVSASSSSSAPVTGDCGCTVTFSAASGEGLTADGSTVKPGSVVCIKAGNYKFIKLNYFKGTATSPITIKNCGGQVVINGNTSTNMSISNSNNFKLTGTGSSDKYGFKITSTSNTVYTGLGVKADYQISDFEIDHFDLYRTSVGFMIKTEPSCDPGSWRENGTIRNVSVHDTYVHQTTNEAFYCGYTGEYKTLTCDGVSKDVYAQQIKGLKIYNNTVDSTGWDGIQVGTAPENVQVYNNKVTNVGLAMKSGQMAGIIFNHGANGSIYDNFVMNGPGAGIHIMGQGKIYIYNNVVANVGGDKSITTDFGQSGIFVDDRPPVSPTLTVFVANNTIVSPKRFGVYLLNSYGSVGNDNYVYNNIFVMDGTHNYNMGASIAAAVSYNASNNVTVTTVAAAKFIDALHSNYRLTSSSPAINAGKDLTSYNIAGLSLDFLSVLRPTTTSKWDAGAYQYTTSTAKTITAAHDATVAATIQDSSSFRTKSGFETEGLKLGPVPATDNINIYLTDKSNGKVAIRVTDVSGRVVLVNNNGDKNVSTWQSRLDISKLTQGVYYCEVIIGNKKYTGKFLKIK